MTATEANGKTYLTCSEATRHCPVKLDPSAVWRWMRKGVVARDGQRVYLRHIRVGRRVFTTAEWLDTFFEQLADADIAANESEQPARPGPSAGQVRRPEQQRAQAMQAAEERLKSAGA